MRLFIAEKPSLGRAIADALPKPLQRQDGYIVAANGDHVTWCIGHLLEQAEPDAYDPVFKQWKLDHLPIIPTTWQLQPKPKTKKQLSVVTRLVKQCSQIIHAGDPDREGQLLVDELIDYLKVSSTKKRDIQRCLISDLNLPAVKKSIASMQSNQAFIPLSISALARARADWLYGINMTRLCTIQGQQAGYQGVLSVGRVQTPTLGLVVERDLTIENFVSKPYFEVFATLQTPQGETFIAKWIPSEACDPYQDEEGRVLVRQLAEHVVKRIINKQGDVLSATDKNKKQSPPLPYNLSSLQIDAARRFGLSAKQALDTCQSLYEKHKLITYPRSDNRYLPQDQHKDASKVLSAMASAGDALKQQVHHARAQQKSKAWNDKKVGAHHAIIPTVKSVNPSILSATELKLYQLIATQYLAQFYPDWCYVEQEILTQIETGKFIAKARKTTQQGWKSLFTHESTQRDEPPAVGLPPVKQGDKLLCLNGEVKDKETQPPAHFTDATLLSALTGIARFVKDKSIKSILRETDGLGTEATRAGIIELLFKRGFLSRQGKQIRATDSGKQLIACLPTEATLPDMTAQWESELDAISQQKSAYQTFMDAMHLQLPTLMQGVDSQGFIGLKGISAGPKKRFFKRKRTTKPTTAKKAR